MHTPLSQVETIVPVLITGSACYPLQGTILHHQVIHESVVPEYIGPDWTHVFFFNNLGGFSTLFLYDAFRFVNGDHPSGTPQRRAIYHEPETVLGIRRSRCQYHQPQNEVHYYNFSHHLFASCSGWPEARMSCLNRLRSTSIFASRPAIELRIVSKTIWFSGSYLILGRNCDWQY